MATADDRIKAMEFNYHENIPVSVNFLPATWMKYREALDDLLARHPIIFGNHQKGTRNYNAVGGTYVEGEHTDAFQPGMELHAKYTFFAEGCRGNLGKQL